MTGGPNDKADTTGLPHASVPPQHVIPPITPVKTIKTESPTPKVEVDLRDPREIKLAKLMADDKAANPKRTEKENLAFAINLAWVVYEGFGNIPLNHSYWLWVNQYRVMP